MGSSIKAKDIAERCNVSVATVSKALNGSKEISPEKIEYINRVAKEMGYIPNAMARSLKKNKTHSIGILFVDGSHSGLRHEYFSVILDSIKSNCEERGYDITFIHNSESMSYLDHARYRNVDGVIIASVDFQDPQVTELVNSDIPTVTIDYVFNGSTAIMSNNSKGMENLVDYVFSKGHKNIALIHGELTDVTQKRLAGFHKACAKNNIKVSSDMILEGDYHDPKKSGRITKNLMSGLNKPTCIFYPDDISLLGGLTALNQMGYRIPKDVSVIGYDGIELSRYSRPMFTTYHQNSEELGKLAALKVIERIEKPNTFLPEILVVDGEVQEGETIADLKK